MNIADRASIMDAAKISKFGKLDVEAKLRIVKFIADISDKYALREMHLESLLAYYCILSDCKDWQDDKKCALCFDIAEAYGNLGYAILALTINTCAFNLIKDSEQKGALVARHHYLSA